MFKFICGLITGIVICNISWEQFITFVGGLIKCLN